MISLSTTTFDLSGDLLINRYSLNETRNRDYERRVSRTATLDGSAVLSDGGYSAGDRTVTIVVKQADSDTIATARYLIQNYSTLWLSQADGAYLSVIQDLRVTGSSDMQLVLLLLGTI